MDQNLALFSITIACLCALVSCDKSTEISSQLPTKPIENSGVTVTQLSDLSRHESGTYTHNGKLFTGRAVEINADGERIREEHFWEGYQHGPVRQFYESGRPKLDTNYEKGTPHGASLEWDEDGNMVQVMYNNGIEQSRSEPRKTNF